MYCIPHTNFQDADNRNPTDKPFTVLRGINIDVFVGQRLEETFKTDQTN